MRPQANIYTELFDASTSCYFAYPHLSVYQIVTLSPLSAQYIVFGMGSGIYYISDTYKNQLEGKTKFST